MSLALILKLTLAPSLIAAATLAGRRFGPRVAGWLIGFPVVAGPVLWFYAREQGAAFAAGAAAGTLIGVLALSVFLVIYAWSAARLAWPASLLMGWLGFMVATAAVAQVPVLRHARWPVGLALAFAALTATMWSLPPVAPRPPGRRPRHDLAMRMVATAALVVSLTGVAHLLGPSLSGLITPFPVATSILVVFAHREAGGGGVIAVYGGFLPSLYSFATFLAALSFALERWPVAASFAFAVGATCVSQAVVLALVNRARARAG